MPQQPTLLNEREYQDAVVTRACELVEMDDLHHSVSSRAARQVPRDLARQLCRPLWRVLSFSMRDELVAALLLTVADNIFSLADSPGWGDLERLFAEYHQIRPSLREEREALDAVMVPWEATCVATYVLWKIYHLPDSGKTRHGSKTTLH